MDTPFAVQDEKTIIDISENCSSVAEMTEDIVGRGSPRICNWGSCQYSYMQDIYEMLLRLQEVRNFSVEEMLKFFSEKTLHEKHLSTQDLTPVQNPFQSARMALIKYEFYPEADEESMEHFDDFLKNVAQCETIDQLFIASKKSSNRLDDTVNVIFDAIFPRSTFVHYSLNDIAYKCWILKAKNLIASDHCLRGFDT